MQGKAWRESGRRSRRSPSLKRQQWVEYLNGPAKCIAAGERVAHTPRETACMAVMACFRGARAIPRRGSAPRGEAVNHSDGRLPA